MFAVASLSWFQLMRDPGTSMPSQQIPQKLNVGYTLIIIISMYASAKHTNWKVNTVICISKLDCCIVNLGILGILHNCLNPLDKIFFKGISSIVLLCNLLQNYYLHSLNLVFGNAFVVGLIYPSLLLLKLQRHSLVKKEYFLTLPTKDQNIFLFQNLYSLYLPLHSIPLTHQGPEDRVGTLTSRA